MTATQMKVYGFIYPLIQRDFEPKDTWRIFQNPVGWSWGINSPAISKREMTAEKDISQALSFKVQGAKFRGWVHIVLAYDDTYTVYFTNAKMELKETMESVYYDEILERIDSYVES